MSVDAVKNNVGIGIKTFCRRNNKTFQKVAEFNATSDLYSGLPDEAMINKIAELRNRRLEVAEDEYGLSALIYHCVVREPFLFSIYEESMDKIQIQNISKIKADKSSLFFHDGHHEYRFYKSKSTLYKRFVTDKYDVSFEVEILKDPFGFLQALQQQALGLHIDDDVTEKSSLWTRDEIIANSKEEICLPLYGKNQIVYPRSGLNQRFADGRPRNPYEVYIPVPLWIHEKFSNFFPSDGNFSLRLPSGNRLEAKLCQAGNKALMSNPNSDLGEWLLGSVLKLEELEVATFKHLQEVGIDSVKVEKLGEFDFAIDFAPFGSFENFKEIYKT